MKTIVAGLVIFVSIFLSKKMTEVEETIMIKSAEEKFMKILEEEGILFPRIVLAQAILETRFFSSKICLENHNLFGMKASSRRINSGSLHGHAYYEHKPHKGNCNIECYRLSIRDYAAWQKVRMKREINTEQEYLDFLNNLPGGMRYAEDPEYTNKLKLIIKQLL